METKDYAMTIKEVAGFLNISTQMVYLLVKNSKLSAFKIGSATRILYSDLNRFILEQKSEFTKTTLETSELSDSTVTIKGLNVRKNNMQLKDIDFSIPKGDILAVIGLSDSETSILLRAIAGLEKIDTGDIYLGMKKITPFDTSEKNIIFLSEDYIVYPLIDSKNYSKDYQPKVIKEIGIDTALLNSCPGELSDGIFHIAGICMNNELEPEIIIMDKPMDRIEQKSFFDVRILIKKVIKAINKTAIISLNNPDDVLIISDYTAVIINGKLLQFGKTMDVINNPVNKNALEVLSKLGVSELPVEVKDGVTEPYNITAEIEEGTYKMAFRAEEIDIQNKPKSRGIPVEVVSSRFYDGNRQIAVCKTAAGSEIEILVPNKIEQNFVFIPKNPMFYPVEEEELKTGY